MARYDEETEKNIQGVVNKKSEWQKAYDDGDEEGMKAAAEGAKSYYNALVSGGNYDVAKKLSGAGYDKARSYLDNYIGTKPEETHEGVSVKAAGAALESIRDYNDFNKKSGEEIFKYNEMQNKRIDEDPMRTEAAKGIMNRYMGLGEEAKDNTMADGSARNDGNLDSFIKAQGDRQKMAYTDAGVQSVIDLHTKNVAAGNEANETLGKNIEIQQRGYEGAVSGARDVSSSEADNEIKLRESEANITGRVPKSVDLDNNMYFRNGRLINPDLDYKAIIDEAEANGDTAAANAAREARNWKIVNIPGYEEYAHSMEAVEERQTEAAREADEAIKYNNKALDAETDYKNRALDADTDYKNRALNAETEYNNRALDAKMKAEDRDYILDCEKLAAQYEAAGNYALAKKFRNNVKLTRESYAAAEPSAAANSAGTDAKSGGAITKGSNTSDNDTAEKKNSDTRDTQVTPPAAAPTKSDIIDALLGSRMTSEELKKAFAEKGITQEDYENYLNMKG